MDDGFFGEEIAARYDENTATLFADEVVGPVVDFLERLAGDGRALELGIGTGRIALPLAERGVRVHGIDISEPMLGVLRAKPGAEEIGITLGDFASARADGAFSLAYLVFNTITNLTTQDRQVACFRNVARHLEPGGSFVIEVGVPGLRLVPPGASHHVFHAADDSWGIDQYEFPTQRATSHHFKVRDGELLRTSMPFRYVWPEELDLMALLAGMRLKERWGDWNREPFTAKSTKHVSVWAKPG